MNLLMYLKVLDVFQLLTRLSSSMMLTLLYILQGKFRDREQMERDSRCNCRACQKYKHQQQKDPLEPHEVPNGPWMKVGADLFQFDGKDYILVIDYMSNYPEVALLVGITKITAVVNHMKSFFARHGIPRTIVTDGGPQFISDEFDAFVKSYGIDILFLIHTTPWCVTSPEVV
ncbi:uncharacterized protein K02A2.6 isoform X1 [Nematostella vectensis]|uniref:uncharacterized protein K02A2.6 isoform X1 n=1 Tax=Nematostella vectensis TaxID=45351 RepID=UPI0020777FC2|nr:uncharacterized protein K02A2.6 isoform X1 [Nematostella vectensis]